MDASEENNSWDIPCMKRGYSTKVGPFPAGTRIGFFLHADGTPQENFPPPPGSIRR